MISTGGIRYIVAGLLVLGMLDVPYGYYIFLRIAVTLFAGLLLYELHMNGRLNTMYLFVGDGILFNPIIPVYLSKEIWFVIDPLTASLIMLSPIIAKDKITPRSSGLEL